MAEFQPPTDDFYTNTSKDTINVNGVEIDLSDYLTLDESATLYVPKTSLTKYYTKEENDLTTSSLQSSINTINDTINFLEKVNETTLKLAGTLQ